MNKEEKKEGLCKKIADEVEFILDQPITNFILTGMSIYLASETKSKSIKLYCSAYAAYTFYRGLSYTVGDELAYSRY